MLDGVFQYQMKHADSYNGPDEDGGVNVNSSALFIRFKCASNTHDGPWGWWWRIGKTRSMVQAEKILNENSSIVGLRAALELERFER